MHTKLSFVAVAVMSMALAACGDKSANASATQVASGASLNQPTSNLPTYKVLTEQLYEPFITRNEKGLQDGFEYELLNAIADNQGFRLAFSPAPWGMLFSDLKNNQTDIISSGISVTPERQAEIDFTDPYFETTSVLLVGKNHPEIKTFADVKGKKLAVQGETTQATVATQLGADVLSNDSNWLAVKSTINGNSVATIGDLGVMTFYAARYPNENLTIVHNPDATKEHLAFGVRKGNAELLNKLNKGLAEIKANGTYDKIYQKWFMRS